jgi:hypothetical protein
MLVLTCLRLRGPELHLDLSTLQIPVLHLDVSTPLWPELLLGVSVQHLDVSRLQEPTQEPVLLLDSSTLQRPFPHLDMSTSQDLRSTWMCLENRRRC